MYRMVHAIRVEALSDAPPSVVYELLKDPSTWPAWSTFDAAELDTPGVDEPNGLGSVRLHVRGSVRGYDEVVELIPDRRFSYRHLRPLPVRDYRADVDLEPTATGTTIVWAVRFRPRYLGTGWIWRIGIRKMLAAMVAGLAAHAATVTDRRQAATEES
jgi:hypothetical protein